MSKSSPTTTRLAVTALSLAFLIALVVIEILLFQRFLDRTYLNFWIEQGPFIAFSLTLIGLVWSDLDKQHPDLVSAHPGVYLRTCLMIVSGLFLAFANSLPGKNTRAEPLTGQVSTLRLVFDSFVALLIYFLLFLVVVFWFLGIAPTMYFVTLISGAPARVAMLVKAEQLSLVRSSTDSKGVRTSESFVLSFKDKPVTVTEALTAGLLTLIKLAGIA